MTNKYALLVEAHKLMSDPDESPQNSMTSFEHNPLLTRKAMVFGHSEIERDIQVHECQCQKHAQPKKHKQEIECALYWG